MAISILVIGEPGTGKSRALLNLNPKETFIIKPNKKDLPFRGSEKKYRQNVNMVTTTSLSVAGQWINEVNAKAPHIKNIVIEDMTHFFTKRTVDERKKTGFGKWMELAAAIKINIIDKEATMRDDLTFFIIGHVDEKSDKSGKPELTLMTPGKLLDRSILVPSYFTYMLHTDPIEKPDGTLEYRFLTNRTAYKVAKTPEDMFPLYIPNDYELIKRYIIAYKRDEEVNLEGLKGALTVSQDTIQFAVETTTLSASEVKVGTNGEAPEEAEDEVSDDGLTSEFTLD